MIQRFWIYASVLLSAFSALTLRGQEPVPHFQSSTNLILVDVRVLDGDGQPIQGLKSEAFNVLDEGILQQISYFKEVALPLTVRKIEGGVLRREESSRDLQTQLPEVAEIPGPEKRLLVFLFDLSSAGLQEISMMGKAAEEFLQDQITAQDSAAVLVMDSGLELLTDFTSDPAVLGRAFRRLTRGEPELDVSIPDEEGQATSEFVADESEFALFQTNQQLSAIQSVADTFREVPGRKALLYFSSGMLSSGIENDEQMRCVADACNRANMSIYSVDTRGLVALSPGG
ncbi:MAG: VWA domain-containing protein, partial [bacterium]